MKNQKIIFLIVFLMLMALFCIGQEQFISPHPGKLHIIPSFITLTNGKTVPYEEGLLFVKENRNNPKSRVAAVHFIRFKAKPSVNGLPVFYLFGGPGSSISIQKLKSKWGQRTIEFFSSIGDLIFVDQRGNANARFMPEMKVDIRSLPLDRLCTSSDYSEALGEGLQEAVYKWKKRGVDISGYDIFHVVDDVNVLRKALGYEKIILRGNSFGSQWAISFIKRYPQYVERALLGGVEPLNFCYDMPTDVWSAMKRIAKLADSDPDLKPVISKSGLAKIIKNLIKSLSNNPVHTNITHPQTGKQIEVIIGKHDLQRVLKNFSEDYYTRKGLSKWPRFFLEMDRGDFRYLAWLTYKNRRDKHYPLIFFTIDNSLGINTKRELTILKDPAKDILGNINEIYFSTRCLTPIPDVGDEFRSDFFVNVPVLLIQGNLDMDTPVENAIHMRKYLRNGHLLYVENGSHLAISEVRDFFPAVAEEILEFLREGDFSGIPDRVSLPAPDFETLIGASLYERLFA
ncbi:MAG: alpha/beta fold hydrolase, partial [Petrotogales bacterium]